jgi:DNA mismatch repair protein MutS
MGLIEEYFELYDKYRAQKGDGTVLLMQVGKFYEMYYTDESKTEMTYISRLLGLQIGKKNGKQKITRKNPYMIGFPPIALAKHLRRLIETGHTVITIDQDGKDQYGNIRRKLEGIYSPGTWIDDEKVTESNNLIGIWIEELEQLSGKSLPALGFASIDLGTGKTVVHESHSTVDEPKLAYDELMALLSKMPPSEMIVFCPNEALSNVSNCTELDKNLIHHRREVPKDWDRVSYQNEVLERVFGKRILSPIEDLDLTRKPYAIRALVMALEWAYEHVANSVKGLIDPETLADDTVMTLGNSAVYQLNVLENSMLEVGQNRRGVRSLFDVVNLTTTVIGRRFLRQQLTAPLVNATEISKRHAAIEKALANDDLYNSIENRLLVTVDLERLHRKMVLGTLHPHEFSQLDTSYRELVAKPDELADLLPMLDLSWISDLASFVKLYSSKLCVARLSQWTIGDIRENIFAKGVDQKLDALEVQLREHIEFMRDAIKDMSNMLGVKLEFNDSESNRYVIKTTSKRAKQLQDLLGKGKKIGGVLVKEILVKTVGKTIRISFKELDQHTEQRVQVEERIASRVKGLWIATTADFYRDWEVVLNRSIVGVGMLDFVKTGAAMAKANKYVRPLVVEGEQGLVECSGLRHAIIERIIDNVYVPHDISLNGSGMLVYGLNGAGKTACAKALGVAVIMAQAGLYVPCDTMRICPYTSIYARITGHDNLFKGLSSFALEMVELRSILKRAGPRTLVLGDEVCRGTEAQSGTAIVASAIERLSETNTSFIFATHLHGVTELAEVKALQNVGFYHIKASWDEATPDKIIYDRTLAAGPGPAVYGLQVARSLIHDKRFISRAESIVQRITNVGELVEKSRSKWNPKVYLTDCQVCHARGDLHTHHIRERSRCVDGYVDHVQRDHVGNLVVLCRTCHEMVHAGLILVEGWVDTTAGRVLKHSTVMAPELKNTIKNQRMRYDPEDWDKRWVLDQVAAIITKEAGVRVTSDAVRRVWWN